MKTWIGYDEWENIRLYVLGLENKLEKGEKYEYELGCKNVEEAREGFAMLRKVNVELVWFL